MSCPYCNDLYYNEQSYITITPDGAERRTKFNYCPCCGRFLEYEKPYKMPGYARRMSLECESLRTKILKLYDFMRCNRERIPERHYLFMSYQLDAMRLYYAALLYELNNNRFDRYCIMDFIPESEPYKTSKCPKGVNCWECIKGFVFSDAFESLITRVTETMNKKGMQNGMD